MENQVMENMMLKFLVINYPISRVKNSTPINKHIRFKRGILLDNGKTYFLSDKLAIIEVKHRLLDILKKVFYCNELTCLAVLNRFL